MNRSPSATLRAVLLGFEALGLDGDALRRAAHVDSAELDAAFGSVPNEALVAVWNEAYRQAPREELPTELGLSIPFGAFGALDYLASSSATVESAYQSLRAHFAMVADVRIELLVGPETVTIQLVPPGPEGPVPWTSEMGLAIFVARFRSASRGGVAHDAVRLVRPPPSRPTRHEELLGAPVRFGCSAPALELSRAAWATPIPSADPTLQHTLRKLAENLGLGASESDLELSLRARLRAALPEGACEASTMAKRLGMSERTLHRRLQEQGKTWRGVLDSFREAEAERLLAAGPEALSQVAQTLGFSDQSAWNRAFKRWKGVSPTEWIREHGARR